MLGANIFLDYDLSRDHARAGFGGEYWRDFLKLSANAYVGLTGWKTSPDVEDYEERPASGWDCVLKATCRRTRSSGRRWCMSSITEMKWACSGRMSGRRTRTP